MQKNDSPSQTQANLRIPDEKIYPKYRVDRRGDQYVLLVLRAGNSDWKTASYIKATPWFAAETHASFDNLEEAVAVAKTKTEAAIQAWKRLNDTETVWGPNP